MLERTLRNIANHDQIYIHQYYRDMSWDRASSLISASAGHGEREVHTVHFIPVQLSQISNPGTYSAIYFKSKSKFSIFLKYNQIAYDTYIRHKVLEFPELIFG